MKKKDSEYSFTPGQLVEAATDLYLADPTNPILLNKGTIGTVMARPPENNWARNRWRVCFEGVQDWVVTEDEISLISPSSRPKKKE